MQHFSFGETAGLCSRLAERPEVSSLALVSPVSAEKDIQFHLRKREGYGIAIQNIITKLQKDIS